MSDSVHTNSRRATSSLKQDLFPAKQRGFYSDILREEAEGELKVGKVQTAEYGVFRRDLRCAIMSNRCAAVQEKYSGALVCSVY